MDGHDRTPTEAPPPRTPAADLVELIKITNNIEGLDRQTTFTWSTLLELEDEQSYVCELLDVNNREREEMDEQLDTILKMMSMAKTSRHIKRWSNAFSGAVFDARLSAAGLDARRYEAALRNADRVHTRETILRITNEAEEIKERVADLEQWFGQATRYVEEVRREREVSEATRAAVVLALVLGWDERTRGAAETAEREAQEALEEEKRANATTEEKKEAPVAPVDEPMREAAAPALVCPREGSVAVAPRKRRWRRFVPSFCGLFR